MPAVAAPVTTYGVKKMKKYVDRATRRDIIRDGWSRGFRPLQIFQELHDQGLATDIKTISRKLRELDEEYEREFPQNL